MSKTYEDRYTETSHLSDEEIQELRDEREKEGKDCGVIYQVQADRENDRARYRRR